MAAPGAPLGALGGLFANLPPASFASGAAALGVPPAALAAGYTVFFFYSCLIGLAALLLALAVARRQRSSAALAQRPASASP